MRRVLSKQRDVLFVYCASPVTIDKRAEWGPDESNLQHAPNGAYLKMNSPTEVSHLVQANGNSPVGWVAGSRRGLFDKSPIWVTDEVFEIGSNHRMTTLDGGLNYEVKEPSMVCYNGDESGPNLNDGWVQTVKNLQKNYEL